MHIAVVTTSYPREKGEGAGSFVSGLNDWLMDCGHSVEVIAAGIGGEDDSWQRASVQRIPSNGLFYRGGAPDALSSPGAKWQGMLFSARMAAALRRRLPHCDGLVAHWLAPCALTAVAAALTLRKTLPMWAIAHGGDVHLLQRLGLAKSASALLHRAGVHVNFVSHANREAFFSGRAPEPLQAASSVASMGIDLASFAPRNPASQSDSVPLVLFVGRLVPIKGVDLLLAALAGVQGHCRVIVAGTGTSEKSLKEQARKLQLDIEWRGEVLAEERNRLLHQARVVVVPSRRFAGRSEGMPLIALEALACKAQLLVSDSGGLAELPASICHRVPAENVGRLRQAIEAILQGKTAAYEGGHWLEERSWQRVGPKILPGLLPCHTA